MYAGVSAAGAAMGLLAGGILTEYLDWRWVLFVNVPIGVALMIGGYLYIHAVASGSPADSTSSAALLSVAGMVGLVYGFIHAAHDGWSNAITIGDVDAVGGSAGRLRRLGGVHAERDDAAAHLRQPKPLRRPTW